MSAAVALLVAGATLALGKDADNDADDEADTTDWYEGTAAQAGPRRETWLHVFHARKTWSVTNGTTWAPSTTLQQDGMRLRLVSGIAAHRYMTTRYDAAIGDSAPVERWANGRTADLLAGYQWSVGAWTLKAFAGAHVRDIHAQSQDPAAPQRLKAIGARGVFEAWYHLSDRAWASVDLNATTVDTSYAGRLRLGWRPLSDWSIGPEVLAHGANGTHSQRLGAFLRYDNGSHELSAAVGYDRLPGQATAPYMSAQWMYRF